MWRFTINGSTSAPRLLARLKRRVGLVLLREEVRGQGRHIDPQAPDAPPPGATWLTRAMRRANTSANMGLFADALRPPDGGTVRDGVIGDLAEYHRISPEQAVERCLGWEDDSVEEWNTAQDLTGFYNSVQSWTFDLLWYAYLQSAGYGYPETVIVADRVGPAPVDGRMLDLGSGTGVTAQLFAALGYDVTLADVSTPLLSFARWRLERRGVKAAYLPLPAELPTDSFDLVTALDVMAHVPDATQTARQVHRALHPGGLFVANFDVRRHSPQNAWHLYEDDLPLRWAVQRAGFRPVGLIDNILWVYRSCPTTGAAWRLRTALAWIRLASPLARALRAARRALARTALVVLTRLAAAMNRAGTA